MFDRANYTTIGSGPTYVTKTVTENRAPTDESVRLLKEMEEKAREKIIESIAVRDCQVECQILFERGYVDRSNHYTIVYSMNGERSKVKVMVHEYEFEAGLEKYVAERLRDTLAKDIATKMIGEAFVKVMK
jgi:hypothetical protein